MSISAHLSSAAVDLTEVIDGISDALTITDDQKVALLAAIKSEGGIVSETLRRNITALFQQEAGSAERAAKETQELLSILENEKQSEGFNAEMQALVSEAIREQEDEHRTLDRTISEVTGYIGAQEDEAKIKKIREGLFPPSLSA